MSTIFCQDDYKIYDKLANQSNQKRGPLGWVQIYMNEIKYYIDTHKNICAFLLYSSVSSIGRK